MIYVDCLRSWNLSQGLFFSPDASVIFKTGRGAKFLILTVHLAGGLERVLFFHICGIIISTDFHIFQRDK